jgi:hypothetical protein
MAAAIVPSSPSRARNSAVESAASANAKKARIAQFAAALLHAACPKVQLVLGGRLIGLLGSLLEVIVAGQTGIVDPVLHFWLHPGSCERG